MGPLKSLSLFFLLIVYQSSGYAASSPAIESYELNEPPAIGTTEAGQLVHLGGFSGLRYMGTTADGTLQFLTHTDRGPNSAAYEEEGNIKRPFLLPEFNPRLVILSLTPTSKSLTVNKQIVLKTIDSRPFSGLPPAAEHNEQPVDIFGKNLPFNPLGIDLEGLEIASDHSYWLVEEYGPSILQFSSDGQLLKSFSPGKGLPFYLTQRQMNRGFESIALQGNKVYVLLQSPVVTDKADKNLPLIEFDNQTQQISGQFIYQLDKKYSDRTGDMVALGDGRFLVIEQNDREGKGSYKKIYLIDLAGATNKESSPSSVNIIPVHKKELLDLAALGIRDSKIEGITLISPNQIALITDNDFSVNTALDRKSGIVSIKKQSSKLYIITLTHSLY
ncbi:hypothetical protein Lbir_1612 [Legionella birminghamensis]|uniref:Uncharacterized protein conserved in bacteria n=1 Tax=Legionella birminghamensis TaxID=28083 RepID=A0A378IBX1_9GAMM|nr:esterase-like activity of phytase family protein [Legionella birminghamensis]KTC71757.1 hypothetical protein Lbir_1612 [Legionella birminghamensis]STX32406.1 Uncharacterized protein conserved in bacteria [Legionella birminghamensis]